jgi:hypothetical protein
MCHSFAVSFYPSLGHLLVKDLKTFQALFFYLMIDIIIYYNAMSLLTEEFWLKFYNIFITIF